MRVAFCARTLTAPTLRGMDRYLLGLVGALAERGVHCILFHRQREPLHAEHLAGLPAEVVAVADRRGLHYEQVALPAALRRLECQVFHAPAENGVPLRAPCPAVLTLHSATQASYRELVRSGRLPGRVRDYLGEGWQAPWSFRRLYWRAQVRRADHLFAPSEFARQELIRLLGVQASRVTTTPLGLPALFRAPPTTPAQRAAALHELGVRPPYLLYVGGYEAHKNVPGLLRTFARLSGGRPQLSLVLVGSRPPDAALRAAAGARVHFLAGLGEALLPLYDAAAVVCSLSWRESFFVPGLEALSRGTPVLASSWGAAPEVLGPHGTLVHPADEEGAAQALGALLDAPPEACAREAMRRWARGFDWSATAATTLAVYRRLVARRADTIEP